MSYAKLPYAGLVECPDCDLLGSDVYIPRPNEGGQAVSTNYWTIYECQKCRASWTLGECHGSFDPPAAASARQSLLIVEPPAVHVCTVEDIKNMPDPEETKGP